MDAPPLNKTDEIAQLLRAEKYAQALAIVNADDYDNVAAAEKGSDGNTALKIAIEEANKAFEDDPNSDKSKGLVGVIEALVKKNARLTGSDNPIASATNPKLKGALWPIVLKNLHIPKDEASKYEPGSNADTLMVFDRIAALNHLQYHQNHSEEYKFVKYDATSDTFTFRDFVEKNTEWECFFEKNGDLVVKKNNTISGVSSVSNPGKAIRIGLGDALNDYASFAKEAGTANFPAFQDSLEEIFPNSAYPLFHDNKNIHFSGDGQGFIVAVYRKVATSSGSTALSANNFLKSIKQAPNLKENLKARFLERRKIKEICAKDVQFKDVTVEVLPNVINKDTGEVTTNVVLEGTKDNLAEVQALFPDIAMAPKDDKFTITIPTDQFIAMLAKSKPEFELLRKAKLEAQDKVTAAQVIQCLEDGKIEQAINLFAAINLDANIPKQYNILKSVIDKVDEVFLKKSVIDKVDEVFLKKSAMSEVDVVWFIEQSIQKGISLRDVMNIDSVKNPEIKNGLWPVVLRSLPEQNALEDAAFEDPQQLLSIMEKIAVLDNLQCRENFVQCDSKGVFTFYDNSTLKIERGNIVFTVGSQIKSTKDLKDRIKGYAYFAHNHAGEKFPEFQGIIGNIGTKVEEALDCYARWNGDEMIIADASNDGHLEEKKLVNKIYGAILRKADVDGAVGDNVVKFVVDNYFANFSYFKGRFYEEVDQFVGCNDLVAFLKGARIEQLENVEIDFDKNFLDSNQFKIVISGDFEKLQQVEGIKAELIGGKLYVDFNNLLGVFKKEQELEAFIENKKRERYLMGRRTHLKDSVIEKIEDGNIPDAARYLYGAFEGDSDIAFITEGIDKHVLQQMADNQSQDLERVIPEDCSEEHYKLIVKKLQFINALEGKGTIDDDNVSVTSVSEEDLTLEDEGVILDEISVEEINKILEKRWKKSHPTLKQEDIEKATKFAEIISAKAGLPELKYEESDDSLRFMSDDFSGARNNYFLRILYSEQLLGDQQRQLHYGYGNIVLNYDFIKAVTEKFKDEAELEVALKLAEEDVATKHFKENYIEPSEDQITQRVKLMPQILNLQEGIEKQDIKKIAEAIESLEGQDLLPGVLPQFLSDVVRIALTDYASAIDMKSVVAVAQSQASPQDLYYSINLVDTNENIAFVGASDGGSFLYSKRNGVGENLSFGVMQKDGNFTIKNIWQEGNTIKHPDASNEVAAKNVILEDIALSVQENRDIEKQKAQAQLNEIVKDIFRLARQCSIEQGDKKQVNRIEFNGVSFVGNGSDDYECYNDNGAELKIENGDIYILFNMARSLKTSLERAISLRALDSFKSAREKDGVTSIAEWQVNEKDSNDGKNKFSLVEKVDGDEITLTVEDEAQEFNPWKAAITIIEKKLSAASKEDFAQEEEDSVQDKDSLDEARVIKSIRSRGVLTDRDQGEYEYRFGDHHRIVVGNGWGGKTYAYYQNIDDETRNLDESECSAKEFLASGGFKELSRAGIPLGNITNLAPATIFPEEFIEKEVLKKVSDGNKVTPAKAGEEKMAWARDEIEKVEINKGALEKAQENIRRAISKVKGNIESLEQNIAALKALTEEQQKQNNDEYAAKSVAGKATNNTDANKIGRKEYTRENFNFEVEEYRNREVTVKDVDVNDVPRSLDFAGSNAEGLKIKLAKSLYKFEHKVETTVKGKAIASYDLKDLEEKKEKYLTSLTIQYSKETEFFGNRVFESKHFVSPAGKDTFANGYGLINLRGIMPSTSFINCRFDDCCIFPGHSNWINRNQFIGCEFSKELMIDFRDNFNDEQKKKFKDEFGVDLDKRKFAEKIVPKDKQEDFLTKMKEFFADEANSCSDDEFMKKIAKKIAAEKEDNAGKEEKKHNWEVRDKMWACLGKDTQAALIARFAKGEHNSGENDAQRQARRENAAKNMDIIVFDPSALTHDTSEVFSVNKSKPDKAVAVPSAAPKPTKAKQFKMVNLQNEFSQVTR